MQELHTTQETAGKKKCATVLSYSGHLPTLHCAPNADKRLKDFPGDVDIDRWWRSVEEKIVEGSLFFAASPTQIETHKIAPWIPPVCQGETLVNTGFAKGMSVLVSKSTFLCPQTLLRYVKTYSILQKIHPLKRSPQ